MSTLFTKISIKTKLIAAMLFVALVVSAGIFIPLAMETETASKIAMSKDLEIDAKLIGAYCSTALLFKNEEAAYEALEYLKVKPYIMNVAVYTADAELLTEYSENYSNYIYPEIDPDNVDYFEDDYSTHLAKIMVDEEFYGYIFIRASSEYVERAIDSSWMFMLFVFIGMILLSIPITMFLQKMISEPILKLATLTSDISKNKDYSLRVKNQSEDEIGMLYDGFNMMLDEISNRIKREEQKSEDLRDSEARYKSVVEFLPIPLIVQSGFKIIYANPSCMKIFKAKHIDEIIDRNMVDFIHPDSLNDFGKRLAVIESDPTTEIKSELQILNFEGEYLEVEVSSYPINYSGQESRIVAITDVNDRNKALSKLRDSEEQYRMLVENQTDLLIKFTPEGKFMFVSRSFCKMFDIREDDLIGKNFLPLVYKEDRTELSEKFESIMEPPYQFYMELRVKAFDTLKWIGWANSAEFDENGNVSAIIASGRDVGERKVAELALTESENRYRTVSEMTSDFAYALRIDNNNMPVLDWTTDAVSRLTGYSLKTIDEWKDCVFSEDIQIYLDHLETLLSGKSAVAEYKIVTKDGSIKQVLDYGRAEFDHDGESIKRINGAVQDISERAKFNIEKNHLYKMLQEKNKELEQIIYVTSHDLRSPLVNIQGFGGELEYSVEKIDHAVKHEHDIEKLKGTINEILIEDIPMSLKFIKNSVEKTDALLKGLLQLSRLGRSELQINEIDMKTFFTEAAESFKHILQKQKVISISEYMPNCWGDGVQINRLFTNIIENAIKYKASDRKLEINIHAEVVDDFAEYCIEDNGIGIDEQYSKKIFEIFHRLNPEEFSGDGLGLTIARKIAERHAGSIRVESEPDKGTKFFIKLPISENIITSEN